MSTITPITLLAPLDAAAAERLAVDGRRPSWRAAPATPEEAAEVLRAATQSGVAVTPRGAGTKLALGAPPTRVDVVLETAGLNGLVLYRPEDLTAVALAGTPLAALQETFAREGQWLALDPPYGTRATLGGVLAANDSGPHRLRYGTARNLVLGMQVAHSDGRLARSGARVVKSVAGYNVHKLHIGALGTLGVIVEVALRLHPLPQSRAAVICPVTRPEVAAAIVERLMRLPLGLGALELLNGRAAQRVWPQSGLNGGPTDNTLIALCEGYAPVVRRQVQEVTQAAVAAGGAVAAVIDDEATALGLATALAALPEPDGEADLVLTLAVPSAQTVAAMADLAALTEAVAPAAGIGAHAGSGVVRTAMPIEIPHIAPLVAQTRAMAQARQGHLVVRRCPPEAKAALDVWGPAAAPGLMREVKRALDPAGTLNPGRFVEGI